MRILKYKNKLVEEIGRVEGSKVIFFKFLKDEDKDKCPHCSKPIEITHDIVENCPNWQDEIEGVETLPSNNLTSN